MGLLAAILGAGVVGVLVRATRNPGVSPLTLVATSLAFVLWYGIPTVAYLFLPWERFAPGHDPDAYARVLALENGVFLAVVVVLLWRRPFFAGLARQAIARTPTSDRVVAVTLLVAIAGSVWARLAANAIIGGSYLERNAFAMANPAGAQGAAGGVGALMILASAIGYATLLRPLADARLSRLVGVLGAVWIAGSVADDLRVGSRIAILVPLVLLALRSVASSRPWGLARLAGLTTLVLGLGVAAAVVSVGIGQTREEASLANAAMAARTRGLLARGSFPEVASVFRDDLVAKFNAPLGGLVLLEAQGPGAAGWRPFEGAALTLVPRFLLRDKPVPGSANGEYSGHPSRIVAAKLGFDPDAGNAGVSVAAVARWELGDGGLLVLVLAGWLNLVLINTMFLGRSLGFRVIGLFMCGVPVLGSVIPAPDVAVQAALRALAMLAVLEVMRLLFRSWGDPAWAGTAVPGSEDP